MRGHEPLLAMRMRGLAPEAVYIDAGPATFIASDWPEACPRFAHLAIDDTEPLTSLDLRCVVGLFVQVSSDSPSRLAALVAACEAEGAARVIGVLMKRAGEFSRLIAVTDTEGVATWQTS